MGVSKVVYDNVTLIDLSNDTVTSDTLARGHTAHSADGNIVVGTMDPGWPPFNATLIAPPYCTVHGTAKRTGDPDENVSWEIGPETNHLISVTPHTQYDLVCDLDIPYLDTGRKMYRVYSATFYTTDSIDDVVFQMIPTDAVFWFGWENPVWARQLVYTTNSGNIFNHKSSSDGTGNAITADLFDLMTLSKENHSYEAHLGIATSGEFHSIAYENLLSKAAAPRYLSCLSDFYWPGMSSTSTSTMLRFDYGCNNSRDAVSSSSPYGMSKFWQSAAGGSGFHCNMTYQQFTGRSLPSAVNDELHYEVVDGKKSALLRCNTSIDVQAVTASEESRARFMLRINHAPYSDFAYYRIYAVKYSNEPTISITSL